MTASWQQYVTPPNEELITVYDFPLANNPIKPPANAASTASQPSIWDSIKEGLYRGLTGSGGSSNPFGGNPFGYGPNDPLAPRMAGQDPRAFEAIPDILKYDVQRLLTPRLNPRGGSIYSGFMR